MSNNIFQSAPPLFVPRANKFDLSQEILTTADLGNIYPVFSDIMLPNTYYKINLAAVVKTAPMFAPIYSGIQVDFAAFAVPLRLLWSGFYDWIYDPNNTTDHMPFIIESDLWDIMEQRVTHNLAGDFDIPICQKDNLVKDNSVADNPITIQDFLAYHIIWQEYFRDEHVMPESSINQDPTMQDYSRWLNDDGPLVDDDPFSAIDYFVRHRRVCYTKDYFTSSLPSPQDGVQSFLSVLNSTQAPVIFTNSTGAPAVTGNLFDFCLKPTVGQAECDPRSVGIVSPNAATSAIQPDTATAMQVYADLTSAAAGISVSDFRSLFAVQSYLEQLMQGGSRFIESTLSFYGCRVRDSRAQRPEFLGVNTMYIQPQEVVAHDAGTLGQLGAFGQAIGGGKPFRYWASEHTVFMIVMYMRPKSLYMQGLPKKFRLNDQFEFPVQLFQHLGEEEVKKEELYYDGSTNDAETFGYQSRYAYWRSSRDRIRGEFTTNLKDWHLGRFFNNHPTLSADFLEVTGEAGGFVQQGDELNRVFNYSGKAADHFYVDIYLKFPAKLPLKYHSKPMLIG